MTQDLLLNQALAGLSSVDQIGILLAGLLALCFTWAIIQAAKEK